MLIIAASNRMDVLRDNLGKSEILAGNSLIVGIGYHSNFNIPQIYNRAEKDLSHTEVMFVHDDVLITKEASDELIYWINYLNKEEPTWSVIGMAGAWIGNVRGSDNIRLLFGHIQDRGKKWGSPFAGPKKVQTLDELCIVVNNRHKFKFDEQFPLDFYAADLCMHAHEKGRGVYVVPSYVHHNSSRAIGARTPSFYESEVKFKKKWAHRLPIATTCSIMLSE